MSHHHGGKKAIFQAMGSNIHETLIFNTEPLECRSKQLREEAKGRNRAAGQETELPGWEWHSMQPLSGAQWMWPGWHSGPSRAAPDWEASGDSSVPAQCGSLSLHPPPELPPVTIPDGVPRPLIPHPPVGPCLSVLLSLPPCSAGTSCALCQEYLSHLDFPVLFPRALLLPGARSTKLQVGNGAHSFSPGLTPRAGSQLHSSPVLTARSCWLCCRQHLLLCQGFGAR